jgi:3-oxoacyl-(acyl-carrier-protein) synthase
MANRVFIVGAGIISPLGTGLSATEKALQETRSAIKPLDLFPLLKGGEPLPVGQVHALQEPQNLPRTHRLAQVAVKQAMAASDQPPDAVIVGNTTGGMLTTEELLRANIGEKRLYRYHGLHSVAEYIAALAGCHGAAITISTACSSGAAAIAMALAMLRSGKARTVLAGGVDSLCRLTYFGFHSLQLVDRKGCRPLDADRRGMAVGEGAAMLLLSTEKPSQPLAELLGAGLSCDAHHPAAPHPEGRGALMAMREALADAGLSPADIGYINLHGTGTPENDLAEAKAINSLFAIPPPLSSIKGATGHSLAASGAIEAVVSVISITNGFLPANTGCHHPDPLLGLIPLTRPTRKQPAAVLSNSFGFGGNNGCLVVAENERFPPPPPRRSGSCLAIHGCACLTGAGNKTATLALLNQGAIAAGSTDIGSDSQGLPSSLVRRLKRLSRMTLCLANDAHQDSGTEAKPTAIFLGSGWGALSETYDFLTGLADSQEQFPSPTDFVGSVHNSPAGQAAIMLGATGANITVSGGDHSFEQALLAAELLLKPDQGTGLVIGVDEAHQTLSPLLDPSISPGGPVNEGGGALAVSRDKKDAKCLVQLLFHGRNAAEGAIESLTKALQASRPLNNYKLLMAGIPAGEQQQGESQLSRFMSQTGLTIPVIRYRRWVGEFASASAVAAVLAASFLASGQAPGTLLSGESLALGSDDDAILVLGLGQYLSAMEFFRP